MHPAKDSLVLVHGAFADGSIWRYIIPLLENDGYAVTAAQLPLSSIHDDIAALRRLIDRQENDVVLVGHSYGGMVTTAAAGRNPQVKSLVYIAGFAPEPGEILGHLNARLGAPAGSFALSSDSAGFLSLNRTRFHELFAHDVQPEEARVLAAVQKPIQAVCFTQAVNDAAWKSMPSSYLVASEDRMIQPELQRFMAKRMGAQTGVIRSSHVPMVSHPDVVAEFIHQAITSTCATRSHGLVSAISG